MKKTAFRDKVFALAGRLNRIHQDFISKGYTQVDKEMGEAYKEFEADMIKLGLNLK